MILEGKFTVKAPLQKLWDAIFAHTGDVGLCVPGMESLTVVDDKTFEVIFKQKVGPLKLKMAGKQVITKLEPPKHVEMDGAWADVMKLGTLNNRITLDLSDNGTIVELAYKIEVSLSGKLNALGAGDRLMKSQASVIEKAFVENLQKKVDEWIAA